jgi:hypothetical protein
MAPTFWCKSTIAKFTVLASGTERERERERERAVTKEVQTPVQAESGF